MNTTILRKCIDELAKDTPDISYVKGMLETLAELNSNPTNVPYIPPVRPTIGPAVSSASTITSSIPANDVETTDAFTAAYLSDPGGVARG